MADLGGATIGIYAIGAAIAFAAGIWLKIRSEARETRKEQAAALDARLKPIELRIETYKPRDQLAEDKAALEKAINDVAHDLKNERQRVDILDAKRQEADLWRVRVDGTITNIKEGQERIERVVEKTAEAVAGIAAMLADKRD